MGMAESPTPMEVHDILHDELNLYTNLFTPLKWKSMVKNDHWKGVCMGHGGVYDGV